MALPFVAGRCATALGQGLNMLSGMSMLGVRSCETRPPGRSASTEQTLGRLGFMQPQQALSLFAGFVMRLATQSGQDFARHSHMRASLLRGRACSPFL
ncbi:hypothetical protein [Comamonas sp.]|uniref:hypothetical protein n=1 Tax=Comamonas sp. TaxID=34028 RepID=UPI0012BF5092|nr:hypothetical protein [Comamonas sp.]MPS93120.1 hypothetical protein [Comamonas sp.]